MRQSSRPTAPAQTGHVFHEFIPANDPLGLPALLIHGFTVRGDMFNPVKEQLAKHHSLLIPDLRGGGRSAHLTGLANTATHADDMLRLMDRYGLPRVHLLGYSMGGIVAQQLALSHPDRFSSLTLACTWAHKQGSFSELAEAYSIPIAIQTMGPRNLGKMLTPKVMREYYGFWDEGIYDWYHHVYSSYTVTRLLEAAHDMFEFDSRRQLPRMRIGTLVVGGEADRVVPLYHSQQLAQLIPNAKLNIVPSGGHGLIFTDADWFAQQVLAHWAEQ